MWEFYLGALGAKFLALPERMSAALPRVDLVLGGGLKVDRVSVMVDMPPNTPVKTAPTYPHSQQDDVQKLLHDLPY